MKVLVIGGNGNTGRRILRRLAQGPHDPVAMIRDPAQRPALEGLGVRAVQGDLEHPIDDAVRGCDAVIFAAGSGGHTGKDKTVLVDHIGAIRAAVTASVCGALRFVMLSATNVAVDSTSRIAHYHRAKAHADHFIRDSANVLERGLDYTIVCPASLHDDDMHERVTVGSETMLSGKTSRESLAAMLVACLDHDNTIGKTFSLLDGDTPVSEAVRQV